MTAAAPDELSVGRRATARRAAGMAALVAGGGLALAVVLAAPADPEFGYDLAAYAGAAGRLAAGEPLYVGLDPAAPIGARGLFLYPPPAAVAFLPLAQLPSSLAPLAWYACLLGLAAAIGAALLKGLPPAGRPLAAAAYVSFLPLLSELRFGNVNLVVLALALLAWHWRRRPALAGAAIALAACLKPLPVLLPLYFALAGYRRVALAAVVVGAAIVAATWPWLGAEWRAYAGLLLGVALGPPAAGSNITPELFSHGAARLALPVVAIAATAAAGLAVRRRALSGDAGFRVALLAAPLIAGSVWYTYLVLALPALLAAPREHPADTLPGWPWRAAAWLAMQLRLAPLPLVGVLALLVGWLRQGLALARTARSTVQER